MIKQLSHLITLFTLTTLASGFLKSVSAQEVTPSNSPIGIKSLADTFHEASFFNSHTASQAHGFSDTANWIFGFRNYPLGSYPEHSIHRDADLILTVYRDAMIQQSQNDPYLRTPDLQNPFNTSLRSNPEYLGQYANPIQGIEYTYQRP